MRKAIGCLMGVLALTSLSCGKNNLYPVTGKVTYRGAPAAGATVFFYRQGADPLNEHLVMGIVQEDGSFELVCGPLGKGAPPGDYDVVIEWKAVSGQRGGQPHHGPDKLKGRYADPKHPRLHVTVKAEPNTLAPFELTD